MKKILFLLTASIVLASCGDGNQKSIEDLISEGDLKAIRAKKTVLSEKYKTIGSQIMKLNSAITVLDKNENFPLVSTIETKSEKFEHFLELQGSVQTKQNVLVYPEMAGTLNRVYVKEGQRVRKGQILATIDDGGMGSQLAQLKTQAELSKTTFDRQKRLWEQKIGSEIQYLQTKATYEAQVNAVKQAESQLGKSTVRAPFSGIIDNVIKEQGTVVAPGPGSEVFRIVNLSSMYVDVDVPEAYLGAVKNGKQALVYFPILNDSVVSKIRQTGNFIDPSNRSFTVEIPVDNKNGNVKPNLTARVKINDYTSDNALLIPQSIISENAEGEQYVYIAKKTNEDESIVKKMIIKTGKTQGAFIEVLSGIDEGTHVVKEGARTVKDGQKVKILN